MASLRKGQGDVKLTREEFERRLRERFFDPAFQSVERQIADVVDVAWTAYDEYHKSPRKRKAGPGFADPEFELPIEWLDTRERIQQAEREQKDASRPRTRAAGLRRGPPRSNVSRRDVEDVSSGVTGTRGDRGRRRFTATSSI